MKKHQTELCSLHPVVLINDWSISCINCCLLRSFCPRRWVADLFSPGVINEHRRIHGASQKIRSRYDCHLDRYHCGYFIVHHQCLPRKYDKRGYQGGPGLPCPKPPVPQMGRQAWRCICPGRQSRAQPLSDRARTGCENRIG